VNRLIARQKERPIVFGKQENDMTPEETVAHHQETMSRLLEDAAWLKQSGFWTETFSNEQLVAALELTAEMYVSVARELTKPTA
jgi:hypothetical protein